MMIIFNKIFLSHNKDKQKQTNKQTNKQINKTQEKKKHTEKSKRNFNKQQKSFYFRRELKNRAKKKNI